MAERAKPSPDGREIKNATHPHFIKAIDDRTVTTLFSVAGNVDSYQDRMWPGAFAKTFTERGSKVLHLWQHDFMQPPIAVIKTLREVGRDDLPAEVLARYPEAMGGAEAVSEFVDTPRGNEVLALLKAGSPLEASFGYDALDYSFTEQDNMMIRELRGVRLWEVSTVLWGANDATTASKMPLEVIVRHLDALTKAGRRHSDKDQELIRQIAKAAIDLGADNVKEVEEAIEEAASKTQQPKAVPVDLVLAGAALKLREWSVY